jgi:hypothetical protein
MSSMTPAQPGRWSIRTLPSSPSSAGIAEHDRQAACIRSTASSAAVNGARTFA